MQTISKSQAGQWLLQHQHDVRAPVERLRPDQQEHLLRIAIPQSATEIVSMAYALLTTGLRDDDEAHFQGVLSGLNSGRYGVNQLIASGTCCSRRCVHKAGAMPTSRPSQDLCLAPMSLLKLMPRSPSPCCSSGTQSWLPPNRVSMLGFPTMATWTLVLPRQRRERRFSSASARGGCRAPRNTERSSWTHDQPLAVATSPGGGLNHHGGGLAGLPQDALGRRHTRAKELGRQPEHMHMRNRYYDPASGQFTQPVPHRPWPAG
jgi:hypothetical protein